MKEFFTNNWPTILIILCFAAYIVYLVVNKKWAELRGTAYRLMLQAEKTITGTKKGQERFESVINYLYTLIPGWLQFFISKKSLREMLQHWYNHIKDYLQDGKVGGNGTNTTPII